MNERGIVCCFCGEAWGYAGEEPTQELIKTAVDHEKTCEKNPYTARIKELESLLKEQNLIEQATQRLKFDMNDSKAWYQLINRISKTVKCLPDCTPDGNGHIEAAIVKLAEENAILTISLGLARGALTDIVMSAPFSMSQKEGILIDNAKKVLAGTRN